MIESKKEVLRMTDQNLKRFHYFFNFLKSRKEVAFETEEFFVRKPSEFKREIAKQFYNSFPHSTIAYHISLEGEPPIFVLDLETNKPRHLRTLLDYLSLDGWKLPIVATSGNSGFHLFYKCHENITLRDMYHVANHLKKEVGIEIDTNIYRNNHLIRGIFSINHKFNSCPKIFYFLKFSIPVVVNNYHFESIDRVFDLSTWNFAKIKNTTTSRVKHCDENFTRDWATPNGPQIPEVTKKIKIDDIKDTIEWIIESGVERGLRHDAIFAITSTLLAMDYDRNKIIQTVLDFNKRCRPPEYKHEVIKQVLHIIRKKYTPPSLNWLIRRGLTYF